MIDHFPTFASIVQKSFQSITKDQAFVVDVDGDVLYQAYLAAFPEGTNPVFKNRTEHDCSYCRQFIRRVGGVVAISNGTLVTVWDKAAEDASAPYNTVAVALRDLVKNANEAAAKKRAENRVEKEKLLTILAEKQDGKLSELSEKELRRRIAALEE